MTPFNLPKCVKVALYPVRYALCSATEEPLADKQHLLKPFFKKSGLGSTDLTQYKITLRRLRHEQRGFVYVYQKDERPEIQVYPVTEACEPVYFVDVGKEEDDLFIAYSEAEWTVDIMERVKKNPGAYMQHVKLQSGADYMEPLEEDTFPTLVEECLAEPRRIMSLRGYPESSKVCDTEPEYLTERHPKGDDLVTERRWRDAKIDFMPMENPYPGRRAERDACAKQPGADINAYLVALLDPLGIARELAGLHQTSCETIGHHAAWYGYGEIVAESYMKFTEANPEWANKGHKTEWEFVDEKIYKIRNFPAAAEADYAAMVKAWEGNLRSNPGHRRIILRRSNLLGIYKFELQKCDDPGSLYFDCSKGKSRLGWLLEEIMRRFDSFNLPGSAELVFYSEIQYDWRCSFIEYAPVFRTSDDYRVDLGALGEFHDRYQTEINHLGSELEFLVQDWGTWLKTDGDFGFCKAFRVFAPDNEYRVKERELAYAACHNGMTQFQAGKSAAFELYFPTGPEAAKPATAWQELFWQILEASDTPQANNAPPILDEGIANLLGSMSGIFTSLRMSEDATKTPGYFQRLLEAAEKRMPENAAQTLETPQIAKSTYSGFQETDYELFFRNCLYLVLHDNETKSVMAGLPERSWLDAAGIMVGISNDLRSLTQKGILPLVNCSARETALLDKLQEKANNSFLQTNESIRLVRTIFGVALVGANMLLLANKLQAKNDVPETMLRIMNEIAHITQVICHNKSTISLSKIMPKTLLPRVNAFGALLTRSFFIKLLGPMADTLAIGAHLENEEYKSAGLMAAGLMAFLILGSMGNPLFGTLISIITWASAGYFTQEVAAKWMQKCIWGYEYNGIVSKGAITLYDDTKQNSYPLFSYKECFIRYLAEKEHPELTPPILEEAAKSLSDLIFAIGNPKLDCAQNDKHIYITFSTNAYSYTESNLQISLQLQGLSLEHGGDATAILTKCQLIPWAPRFADNGDVLCWETILDKGKLFSFSSSSKNRFFSLDFSCIFSYSQDITLEKFFIHIYASSTGDYSHLQWTPRNKSRYEQLLLDYCSTQEKSIPIH